MQCVLFICVLCEKKYVIPYLSLCHYVILSYKNHQFLSVTLLFCLQKTSVSFRHSVILSSKKRSVYLCHYVIMSSKKHLSLSVTLLFCLKTPQLVTEAGPAAVVVISFLSVLYQYFISSATSSPTTFLQYILFDKVVEITSCGILRTVSYLVPLRGSKLSFKTIEEHVEYLSLSVV